MALPAGQIGEIDPVPPPLEADVEAVMPQTGPSEPCTDAHRVQQVHCALLENAGPHSIDHVVTAAVLDDDRIDAIEVKEMTQQQPGRTGANDSDLRPQMDPFVKFVRTRLPWIATHTPGSREP